MKEKTYSQRVGEQIRLIRLEKNLSQNALATEFNISVSTVSNLERGTTEFTMSRLDAFLKYLNINILSFFAKVENIRLPESILGDIDEKYLVNNKQKEMEEQIRQLRIEMERLKK